MRGKKQAAGLWQAIARLRPNYVSSHIARGATADEQTAAAENLLRMISTWVTPEDQIFATSIDYRFSSMDEGICIDLVCRPARQMRFLFETLDRHVGLSQEDNEERERQAWIQLLGRHFMESEIELLGRAARSTAVFRSDLSSHGSDNFRLSGSNPANSVTDRHLEGIDDARQGKAIYSMHTEGSEAYPDWGVAPPLSVRVRPETCKGGYLLHVIQGAPELAKRKIVLLTNDLDKQSFLNIADAIWDRRAIDTLLRVASTAVRGKAFIGRLERVEPPPYNRKGPVPKPERGQSPRD